MDIKVSILKTKQDELTRIENEFSDMISATGDDALMDKFLEWTNQRLECNKAFNALVSVGAQK